MRVSLRLSLCALISGSDQQDAAGATAHVEQESSDVCRFCARCSGFIRKQQNVMYLDRVGLLMNYQRKRTLVISDKFKVCSH